MPLADLLKTLRGRVVAALHSGQVHPGDRLPSVRELAAELGEDPRTVLRAYRTLESEGLVEIRTRSGVYLARQEQVAPEVKWETSRWVADEVLTEAWRRRIRIPELPDFIRRCTAMATVRCACIDAVEDHRVALCGEIREDFGMHTMPIPLRVATRPGEVLRLSSIRAALEDADLLVTTGFHAAELRPVAEELGKPLVVMRINPLGRAEIERLQREGTVTFVVVDPAFEERLRLIFGDDIRVVLAEDRRAVAALDPAGRTVISHAAALRLGDRRPAAALTPHTPVISVETARELAHWLVQFNLRAMRSEGEGAAGDG